MTISLEKSSQLSSLLQRRDANWQDYVAVRGNPDLVDAPLTNCKLIHQFFTQFSYYGQEPIDHVIRYMIRFDLQDPFCNKASDEGCNIPIKV